MDPEKTPLKQENPSPSSPPAYVSSHDMNCFGMSNRHEIDPEGDLILTLSRVRLAADDPSAEGEEHEEIDEDETLHNDELRVSSKVLQLNSPVFKAMLSGKFKEATELAEKKGTADDSPYDLDLPDDDVEAMSTLCRILHNVYVPESPRPVALERLAFVCDKYECVGALKYCAIVWIRDWLAQFDDEVPPMSDFCHLLVFAYVIDLPVEFSEISWRIFLYHEGPFSTASEQVRMLVDHPLLRHDFISECALSSEMRGLRPAYAG
ncbi:hypothetical protein CkaCkLH20_02192 [Colletotrichum karsti]|uniref:BTB domain-containing protein n=1 Tax=Colletotrichum karsti TaxID=1095194 RepID=A0A9P6IAQ2_9PEZI|nr:uncharacterized protein CkaCkLH20_02192 [Colletotrichum karsti]KAF9880238.1 hypothetical protein CkaCkLH20_02192 [Colletotrichum karsti]